MKHFLALKEKHVVSKLNSCYMRLEVKHVVKLKHVFCQHVVDEAEKL